MALIRGLLYNGRNNMQAWGLIVLLVSKAAGHLNADGSAAAEQDKSSGVLRSQRALAEIAEMIRTSRLMHKGLMNIYPSLFPEPVARSDMCFGNKIALLSGDYLLANSYNELSALKNQKVSDVGNHIRISVRFLFRRKTLVLPEKYFDVCLRMRYQYGLNLK